MGSIYAETLHCCPTGKQAVPGHIFTKVSIDHARVKPILYSLSLITEEEQEHFLFNWLPTIEEKIIQNYTNQYVCFSSVLK